MNIEKVLRVEELTRIQQHHCGDVAVNACGQAKLPRQRRGENMVVLNQVTPNTVQGIFHARLSALALKNTTDGSELTITLKLTGEDVSAIAANLSALDHHVKVILEGEAQQLTFW